MQTCLIFNPSARGQKAENFRARLGQLFPKYSLRHTQGPSDARRIAREAVSEGFSTIVAVGGDGTANEVVNGIADVPTGLATARFGLIPLGTINVFAREMGLPRNLRGAAETLAKGRELTVDLGKAEFVLNGAPVCRYFVQLAGAGLDARAVELVSWELKKKTGPLAYVVAGLRALSEPQPTIEVNGAKVTAGQLVLLGNGRFYGGSFALFPDATLQDGELDVCVLLSASPWVALQCAMGLITGRVHRFWPSQYFRSATVTLRSSSRVGLQLDGEFAGELPVTFTVLPKALRVVVP